MESLYSRIIARNFVSCYFIFVIEALFFGTGTCCSSVGLIVFSFCKLSSHLFFSFEQPFVALLLLSISCLFKFAFVVILTSLITILQGFIKEDSSTASFTNYPDNGRMVATNIILLHLPMWATPLRLMFCFCFSIRFLIYLM